MAIQYEDLSSYQRDPHFYGRLDLILTVKSFDLQAIRARYLKSRANASGASGSVERRAPSTGGVVRVQVEGGRLQSAEVLARLKEPRGIDALLDEQQQLKALALSAENVVHWWHKDQQGLLKHPWFSYLHTVQFHPEDMHRLLISSSGYDYIQETDLKCGEVIFDWLAWEHGFDQGRDPGSGEPVFLTRDAERASVLQAEGKSCMLIQDPPEEAIPTARRAAFINSVCYNRDKPGELLATFFHKGAVYAIERNGSSRELISGLRNPHGGRNYGTGMLATSTAAGKVIWKLPGAERHFDLTTLPGKDPTLGDWEWVQNSLVCGDLIISIDSNRNALVIFEPLGKKLDMIAYPEEWAVQDAAIAPPDESADAWVRSLSEVR